MIPRPEMTGWIAGRGGVGFILSQILDENKYDTSGFWQVAKSLKGNTDRETFKNIWSYVRRNVKYIPDQGEEVVKSAARTLYDGYADCKSMSILTAAILRESGYTYFFRVTGYDKQNPNRGHIYVMAVDKKERPFVVDPVNGEFGKQPKWVWKKDTTVFYPAGKTSLKGMTL